MIRLRLKVKEREPNRKEVRVSRPVDVFKACPRCKCPELIPFEGDVICLKCDWNSIALWVEAKIDARAAMAKPAGAEPDAGAFNQLEDADFERGLYLVSAESA